jgi:acetyl-CoA carboxylase biotin carboxyl carrier protein
MTRPSLLARLEREDDGTFRVLAPRVGLWSSPPGAGEILGPGSRIGRLRRLNRSWELHLPPGPTGRVAGGPAAGVTAAVEFGQLLFRLEPLGPAASADETRARGGPPDAAAWPSIASPTDGVFHRRPAPDAAPFVEPGERVESGRVVGLVEVMKTFHRILHEGSPAVVEAILCEDGAEVSAGQPLIRLRAAASNRAS